MSEFYVWFNVGWDHIINIDAVDHLLYLTVVSLMFPHQKIKAMLIGITAFTIGHSAAILFTATDFFNVKSDIIEILIAFTIVIGALTNILSSILKVPDGIHYFMSVFFGSIHGMGFSGYLRSFMSEKGEVLRSLFAFNVGIETAQIIIVSGLVIFYVFSEKYLKINYLQQKRWISAVAIAFSVFMIVDRLSEI